jgi:hypothetical protein
MCVWQNNIKIEYRKNVLEYGLANEKSFGFHNIIIYTASARKRLLKKQLYSSHLLTNDSVSKVRAEVL